MREEVRIQKSEFRMGFPFRSLLVFLFLTAAGCSGPRVVFLPATDAPVRAGPNLSGRVYVWTGTTWELSGNSVTVPEGFYIWDAGDAAPTNTAGGK